MKFRLVDQITSWTPWERISGLKAVSFEEYSLKEPFGDEPRLPELLLLESILQLGDWLVMLSSDFQQMGVVLRISEARFLGGVLPGQKVRLDVRLVRRREDGWEFAGEGHAAGRPVIAGFGCLATPVPLTEYLDAEDLRVVFSEICPAALSKAPRPGAPAASPSTPQSAAPASQEVSDPGL